MTSTPFPQPGSVRTMEFVPGRDEARMEPLPNAQPGQSLQSQMVPLAGTGAFGTSPSMWRARQSATPATPGGGLSDTDLQALVSGDIVPLLEYVMAQTSKSFIQGGPQRADYGSDEEYEAALASWDSGEALSGIVELATTLDKFRKLQGGQIPLPDGSGTLSLDMINSPDPAIAAYARTIVDNFNRDAFNSYNTLMNNMGLSQFEVDTSAASFENDQRQAEFTNSLAAFRENTDWDKLNVGRAADEVNRHLSGLQESRSRADLETQAQLAAAPYATGGKTEFTPNDIGALGVEAGRMAGLMPDQVAIRYPSTMVVDPGAMMRANDAALGVTGPIPTIPQLTTSPNMIPAPPTFVSGPPAPRMQAYAPPAMYQLPPYQPAAPAAAPAMMVGPSPLWSPGPMSGPMP